MKTIVATDIHGVTPELRSLLAVLGSDVIFLSPWETDLCPFENEQEAHSKFIDRQGIESYAEKISVATDGEPTFLIAFSVGASAAWLHSNRSESNPKSKATLFYGSRIRSYATLSPKFEITAIFAEQEPAFSPRELARTITRSNVLAVVEPSTLHGFMNPCSANYAPAPCSVHLQRVASELEQYRHRMHAVLTAGPGGQ